MKFLLFFMLQLICLQTFSMTCVQAVRPRLPEKPLKIDTGQQVYVRLEGLSLLGPESHWKAGAPKDLVYIGQILKGKDVPIDLLIFSDAELNTYYLPDSIISINNQPASFFDTQQSQLAPMIIQTKSSCNLCANFTALNQLAINHNRDPIRLSGRELEENIRLNHFSDEQLIYNFFRENIQWGEVLTSAIKLHSSLRRLRTQILEDQEGFSLLPFKGQGRLTLKNTDFIQHMREGGIAVISGRVAPSTQNVTNLNGHFLSAPKTPLLPATGKLMMLIKYITTLPRRYKTSQKVKQILNEGKVPPNSMFSEMGAEINHVVAAVKLIEEGPLVDHVIIINSIGLYEIYPLSHFRKGLQYRLISPQIEN